MLQHMFHIRARHCWKVNFSSAEATLSTNPITMALACMQLALARSWALSAQFDEYKITVQLMIVAQLARAYGKPFHALGVLKEIGRTLHLARSRLSSLVFSLISKIHCILERFVKLQHRSWNHTEAVTGTHSLR
jgi:hypothetical protein